MITLTKTKIASYRRALAAADMNTMTSADLDALADLDTNLARLEESITEAEMKFAAPADTGDNDQ